MNDELKTIIEAKDKTALDEYAEVRGVSLDRRKSFDRMLADFEAETAEDGPEAEAPAEPTATKIEEPKQEPDGLPLDAIKGMAHDWADGFAKDIVFVEPSCHGMDLTIVLQTRHGLSRKSAPVAKWTAAEVKKALADIRAQMGA